MVSVLDFQSKDDGSIPFTCSKKSITLSFNIICLEIKKCNCDVHTIVPADMRFVYNPIRIRI